MRFTNTTCLALGLLLAWRSVAAALPHPTARLEVTRGTDAQSCIDAPRLSHNVEARLGRSVFRDNRLTELTLKVELRRTGARWIAEIALADQIGPLGKRDLFTEAAHCSALDDSLALVVALLVDTPPERAPPAASSSPTPGPEAPDAAVLSARTSLELPRDTLAPRQPWEFELQASVQVLAGLVPGAAFGPELAIAARSPRGPRLRLLGDLALPSEARLPDGSSGARLSAERFGLEICALDFGSDAARFAFCFGQRVGRIATAGFGFDHNRSSSQLFFAPNVGLNGLIPLGRYVGFSFGIRAEVPATRTELTARSSDGSSVPLFRGSPVIAAATIGALVRL